MTLGQRIQQLRKEHGMSQEALGEQLGVSRQAISKWESDNTIPEIDKLIALAKLFGVSVGILLGVEEDDPSVPAAEELTDRELKAIEAIVSRYLEKTQQQKPKRKIWPVIIPKRSMYEFIGNIFSRLESTQKYAGSSLSVMATKYISFCS